MGRDALTEVKRNTGCGAGVSGHGEYAECGREFYGRPYLCDRCLYEPYMEVADRLIELLDSETATADAIAGVIANMRDLVHERILEERGFSEEEDIV